MSIYESQAITSITMAEPNDGKALACILAQELAPLSILEAFTTEPHKLIALGIQAALAGDLADCTQLTINAHLSGMTWGQAYAAIYGKQSRDEAGTGSALARMPTEWPNDMAAPTKPSTFKPLAVVLRNLARKRKAADLVTRISTALDGLGANQSPDRIIAHAMDKLSAELSGGLGSSLADHAEAMLNQADARRPDEVLASWGVADLDDMCPLRAGRLYVLSAPPGCGKTSLALQAATASGLKIEGGHVGIVSLEMSGGDLSSIVIARELRCKPTDIVEGTLAPHNKAKARDLVNIWKANPSVWVSESGSGRYTIDTLAAWARTQHANSAGRMRLLIVDYLQLIDGQPRASEYDTITANTRALKRLAMNLGIPVLCLSQLNREGRKEGRTKTGTVQAIPEPRLSDLRGSGSIEQDADVVVFCHLPKRPDKDSPTVDGQIIVAKNRRSGCGTIPVRFFGAWQLFHAVAPEAEKVREARAARAKASPTPSEDAFADMSGRSGG